MTDRIAFITGAAGLIGSHLVRTAPSGWQVYGVSRADLDITDLSSLRDLYRRVKPDVVIHCAAMSSPDQCERQPELAYKANVESVRILAEEATEISLVFFSSSLVFDGRDDKYAESAPVNPINRYGEMKVMAEQAVLANPRHTVIRTSIQIGASSNGARTLNEDLYRRWRAGEAVTLYSDEYRCPIPVRITARATWELAEKSKGGIYHLVGTDCLSRYEIGALFAARWRHLNVRLKPGSRLAARGAARPERLHLDCAKIQRLLSFPLPGLTDWLRDLPDGELEHNHSISHRQRTQL